MLSSDSIFALMAYAFVMTITPGPNNVLLLSSGLNFGLHRTLRHLAGILTGTLLMIGLVGLGLGVVFTQLPGLQVILKLLGSVYMLWLASQLWRVDAVRMPDAAKPVRFGEALLFQWVNPKVWVMATTVNTVFVPAGEHYVEGVAIAALVFIVIAMPCITLWAASGAVLRRWIQSPVALRKVNRGMAILCVLTVVLFWL